MGGGEMCRNMEKIIFFPNQISRVVNSLKRDSISVPNKKIVDIVTSHVILQQFCMELFSFMAGLEHQENVIEIQITTSTKMTNNTTAD
jgi:hypothetical protein